MWFLSPVSHRVIEGTKTVAASSFEEKNQGEKFDHHPYELTIETEPPLPSSSGNCAIICIRGAQLS
jgi:hypothetical protein